jgi:phosphoglycerate-specific signal transduction histidine kinase
METPDEGKAEKLFRDLGKRLDQFAAEAQEAGSRMETDFRKKFEELKTSAERLKKETENKERWKEVELALKKAGEELEKAAKAAFGKRETPNT